jgi:hypothetical protein
VQGGPFHTGDAVTVTWSFSGVQSGDQATFTLTAPNGAQIVTKLHDPDDSTSNAASGSESINAIWDGTYTLACQVTDASGASYSNGGSFTVTPARPASITSCTVSLAGDQATVSWQTQGNGFTQFNVGVVNGHDNAVAVPAGTRSTTISLANEQAGTLTIAIEPEGPSPAVDTSVFGCTPDLQYSPPRAVPPVVTLGISQVNGTGTRAFRQQQLNISWSEPPMVGWRSPNFLGSRSIISNETSIWVDCGFVGDFIAVSQTLGESSRVRVNATCAPATGTLALVPLDAHTLQGTFAFTPDLSVVQSVSYWTLIDGQPGPTIHATPPSGPGNTMTFVIPNLPAGKSVTVLSSIGVVGAPTILDPRATINLPAAGAALGYRNATVPSGGAISVPPTSKPQGQSFTVSSVPNLALTVDAGGTVRGTAPTVAKTTVYSVTVSSAQPSETATFTVTVSPLSVPAAASATTSAAAIAAATTGSGGGSAGSGSAGGSPSSSSPGGSTGSGGASSGSTGSGLAPSPCLASNGSIYPDLSGSVGSTLTMAPNLTGLRPAIKFAVVSGTLPQGMWLDDQVGVVSGTPLHANGGWAPVSIRVTFADGATQDSSFNIAVDDPHHSANYPNRIIGSIGEEVVIAPLEVHTQGATTFKIVCGTLPQGLKFNAETGEISGTPTSIVERPVPLRVRMTDEYGWVDTSFIVVVNQGVTPWLRYADFAQLDRNAMAIIDPTRSALPGDTRYTITGKLPRGLTFDKVTGAIYGKPAVTAGSVFHPTVRAYDKVGQLIATTWASITVTKPSVPMKVTARSSAQALSARKLTLVTSVKHPSFASLAARVSCGGCKYTFNKKTGQLVVSPKKGIKTIRVSIVGAPISAANRQQYSSHVWSRSWKVRS